MTLINVTPIHNLPAYTPSQIAVRLLLLQRLVARATSGHARAGTREAYRRRPQVRRDLDCRHLFHWQIVRGVTAIGVGDAVWQPEICCLIRNLCTADGIACWFDPARAVVDELIDRGAAAFRPFSYPLPDLGRLDLMRAASPLAPTVNLARPPVSPIVIFASGWAGRSGLAGGLHANDEWRDMVDRLRTAGFRVIILCADAHKIAGQFAGIIDHVLPLSAMSDWVFRKLCLALCGHAREPYPWDRGDVINAATPLVLNMAWKPGMSPEVLRIRVLETARELRVQGE